MDGHGVWQACWLWIRIGNWNRAFGHDTHTLFCRLTALRCRFNIDECILFTPHTLSGPRLSFQATNETFSRHATSYRTRRRRVQLSLSLSFLLTYRSNEPQRPPHRKLKQDFYGCYTCRARVLGR
ncbi:uncharacterized protein CC84DRAFT_436675 [Paraphaeosphaeria sporulosa]|uniref:Uncharacterized protein n=1 Tax=Paraphaeosphaeria sporulosa TaxID=1460663 RepID=A0A177CQ39_9PLEO|nr:uncharacterized protein CC84DRAFT_436675 [Paraphaeosphaeria sporulosa]OAG09426.1 hypothetical protein CC84DRAFT_436675 [Paraphaeosphaeria sporulosa]